MKILKVSGILLEILQLLQRHGNGLDEVEREVHVFQLGQLASVLKDGFNLFIWKSRTKFVLGCICYPSFK